jgi:2,5-dioxopentanoate dehydrogenase
MKSLLLNMNYSDASPEMIDAALQLSAKAFKNFKKTTARKRQEFLYTIASELEVATDDLIHSAMKETHLSESRCKMELSRTRFQLKSYGDAAVRGDYLDIRIDVKEPGNDAFVPTLHKMNIPLGPVVVFGASNFPFAYATPGGDTASALAAGCSIIVKAHPAHSETSEKCAAAILRAVEKTNMPEGTFIHLHGASFEVGKQLVMHPQTQAVGFTGSFSGGKQIFDWAVSRPVPIPVYAEMGSCNPVYLLPGKLKKGAETIASQMADSLTLNAGQFCTNPGLMVAIESPELDLFIGTFSEKIRETIPETMLHAGIAKSFHSKKNELLAADGVELIARSEKIPTEMQSEALLARTSAAHFMKNKKLHEEIFGPLSLLIVCRTISEMQELAEIMEGQLTSTIWADEIDLAENENLIDLIRNRCGRLVLNDVPTGVQVKTAMHHGGPFPATTDSRFTSVGDDALLRFVRPICFQNWPDELLPDELKEGNPLGIKRTLNNQLSM